MKHTLQENAHQPQMILTGRKKGLREEEGEREEGREDMAGDTFQYKYADLIFI